MRKAVSSYFQDPSGTGSHSGSASTGTGETVSVNKDNMTELKDKLEQAMKKSPEFEKLKDYVTMSVTGEGLRVEKLVSTPEPLRYDFEHFFYASRLIKTDHRLRLVVRPNHTIKWEKNYNSGKPVAEETMADARTVTVKLFHDADHPSALIVPIGQPDEQPHGS